MAILIRNEVNYDYPKTEMTIGGKKIYKSVIKIQEGDIFILMSDGCPHAGIGTAYNFGWKREDIITYMEAQAPAVIRPRPFPPFWWTSATGCTTTSPATIPPPAWFGSASGFP